MNRVKKNKVKKSKRNNAQHNNNTNEYKHIPARFYYDTHRKKSLQLSHFLPKPSHDQPTIHDFTITNLDRFPSIFGDALIPKEDGICRIVSQNVGCLGVSMFGNNKLRTAKEWLLTNQVDICGWQEIGFANHLLPRHERMSERLSDRRWKAVRTSTSTNTFDDVDKFQWGGTATVAFNIFAYMRHSSGTDESGLGRWSWILLEGHKGVRVRVITAYNPCKTRPCQLSTVYAQHRRYFLSKNNNTCPRIMFAVIFVVLSNHVNTLKNK